MIDLHTHSNISDGSLSPKELIQLAKKNGLTAVALTDHDSIDGLDEAQTEADNQGITLIKGIEFSAAYGQDRLIHILGLGIDTASDGFWDIYSNYRKIRSEKLGYVFEQLHKRDVEITPEDAMPYAVGGYLDRQAIAKSLIAKGYASVISSAWIDYLDYIPYIEGELIDPREAMDAIHAAGGKAFMAHFHMPIGLKGYSETESRQRLEELKSWGLDGMEYYYPSYTEDDSRKCARYIEDFGFLISGGTDFHGANRPGIHLGTGNGNFRVPDDLLKEILLPEKRALCVS